MLLARITKFCSTSSFSISRFFSSPKLSASPPKPRLRKSERLQRDVDLLLRIVRSKASWGASTAKRLKQSNVELTPFHVTEVLRLHRVSIDRTWKFFKWAQQQKRCKRGLFMYSKMCHLLGNARRFEDLWSLLEDMKSDGRRIPPELFLGVIRSYVKANQVSDALKAFQSMESFGCKPTTLVFNSVIDIFRDAGDYAQVESLFRNMQDCAYCDPDTVTYTMMIDCKGKTGQVEAAFELFQEMNRKGYIANVITYSSLINALGKAGRVAEACNLMSGMQINGCKPNSVTYNGLIVSLGGAGQEALACSYHKEMIALGLIPNVATQAVVVACLLKIGNFVGAHELFRTAVSTSRLTDFDVMKSVVGSLCKAGQSEAGLKFFQHAKKKGCEASAGAYSVLIYSLAKSGYVVEALDLFGEMTGNRDTPDVISLKVLINGLVHDQKFDAAIDVARLMIKRKFEDNFYAPEKLVTLLCKTHRFKDAHQVINQELMEKGHPRNIDLYNILILQLERAGQVEEAFKIFERMGVEGCQPDTRTYNIVINFIGSVGKVGLARQLFEQMKERGCEPDIETYGIIVSILVHAGWSELSLKVCQEMVSKHSEPQEGVLNILRRARGNDSEEYRELLNTFQDLLKGDRSASIIDHA